MWNDPSPQVFCNILKKKIGLLVGKQFEDSVRWLSMKAKSSKISWLSGRGEGNKCFYLIQSLNLFFIQRSTCYGKSNFEKKQVPNSPLLYNTSDFSSFISLWNSTKIILIFDTGIRLQYISASSKIFTSLSMP